MKQLGDDLYHHPEDVELIGKGLKLRHQVSEFPIDGFQRLLEDIRELREASEIKRGQEDCLRQAGYGQAIKGERSQP